MGRLHNNKNELLESIQDFIRNNTLTIILSSLYICFTQVWESLFQNWIIPIISAFTCNWATTILFIISVCLILYAGWDTYKKKTQISDLAVGMSIFSLLIWYKYRIYTNTALPTVLSPFICYVDIIPIVCVTTLLVRFVPSSKDKNKTNANEDNGFLIDSPIDDISMDILNRSTDAKDLGRRLLATNTEKEAFTLGIVAPWGEGKTSFINLMKEFIPEKGHITITFNPWLYRKDSNLTSIFFDELEKAIAPFSSTLSSDINKYAQLLTDIDNNWMRLGTKFIGISNNKITHEQYKVLKKILKKFDRKIIIFIDDIDRLNSEEIEEILRLVRNTSNLPNMYFVLAYDKKYVIDSLTKLFANQSLLYTDKILQEEFVLPKATQEQLKNVLLTSLEKILTQENFSQLKENISGNFRLKIKPMDYIHTLRDVKKITNEFVFNLRNLQGEVNVIDFFIFELFKHRYPFVVNLFTKRHKDILIYNNEGKYEYFNGENAPKEPEGIQIYKKDYFNILKYIKEHVDEMHIVEEDIDHVQQFIESLFGHYKISEIGTINNPMYMHRYLYCNLLSSDISELEFKQVYIEPFEQMKPQLSEWMINKAEALIYRLEKIQLDKSREAVYKHLHILFFVGSINYNISPNFNYIKSLIASLLYIEGKIDKHTNQDLNTIWECLTENPVSYFLRQYLFSLFQNGMYEGIFPEKKIKKLQSDIFIEYLRLGGHSVKDIVEWWYYTGTRTTNHVNSYNCTHSIESKDLLKEYLKLHISEAISAFIRKEPLNDYSFSCSSLIEDVWADYDNFSLWLNSIDSISKELQEFKEFFEKYKKNGYKPVNFNWKYVQFNQ